MAQAMYKQCKLCKTNMRINKQERSKKSGTINTVQKFLVLIRQQTLTNQGQTEHRWEWSRLIRETTNDKPWMETRNESKQKDKWQHKQRRNLEAHAAYVCFSVTRLALGKIHDNNFLVFVIALSLPLSRPLFCSLNVCTYSVFVPSLFFL